MWDLTIFANLRTDYMVSGASICDARIQSIDVMYQIIVLRTIICVGFGYNK